MAKAPSSTDDSESWLELRDEDDIVKFCTLCNAYATGGHLRTSRHVRRAKLHAKMNSTEARMPPAHYGDARFFAWMEDQACFMCLLCDRYANSCHVAGKRHQSRLANPEWYLDCGKNDHENDTLAVGAAWPPPPPSLPPPRSASAPSFSAQAIPPQNLLPYAVQHSSQSPPPQLRLARGTSALKDISCTPSLDSTENIGRVVNTSVVGGKTVGVATNPVLPLGTDRLIVSVYLDRQEHSPPAAAPPDRIAEVLISYEGREWDESCTCLETGYLHIRQGMNVCIKSPAMPGHSGNMHSSYYYGIRCHDGLSGWFPTACVDKSVVEEF